mmetsp:Transcript_26145/g.38269  ORF Transcript_26145/g.38269 Transcript_26145/m.38269 type:complete len:84 (+) Transcript_26145:47-298(+)
MSLSKESIGKLFILFQLLSEIASPSATKTKLLHSNSGLPFLITNFFFMYYILHTIQVGKVGPRLQKPTTTDTTTQQTRGTNLP